MSDLSYLCGCVNAGWFRGHPPGTLLAADYRPEAGGFVLYRRGPGDAAAAPFHRPAEFPASLPVSRVVDNTVPLRHPLERQLS